MGEGSGVVHRSVPLPESELAARLLVSVLTVSLLLSYTGQPARRSVEECRGIISRWIHSKRYTGIFFRSYS